MPSATVPDEPVPSDPVLAPGVAPLVAHLHGKTYADVAAGTVEAPVQEPAPVPGVESVDLDLPGTPPVPVRRYHPSGPGGARRPLVVWVHGGAWMFGDLDQPEADAVARRMCRDLDAIVYSVDYRLAPAHTFPAALDDVVAAFVAACDDPQVDASRSILGGASAGGNIVGGAAQVLRDRGLAQPAAVVLAYPATDPVGGPYPEARPAVCPELLWFEPAATEFLFSVYLGGATDVGYAVPAAGTLAGLPPTLITTSPIDALADQALRYAALLRDAGVPVDHHDAPGLLHGYLSMVGVVDAADAALDRHIQWMSEVLARSVDAPN